MTATLAGDGVVPANEAFSGFGHPATVIIALVLVVSRALTNSGVIELIGRLMLAASRSLSMHIGLMAGVAAFGFIFVVLAFALRPPELEVVLAKIRRKLRRSETAGQ